MVSKGTRQDCFGGCGARVLPFYNPSGYCRKCQRLNAHKAMKLKKKERESNDD